MGEISWDDFAAVGLRAGTVTQVEDFPEARKPAYRLLGRQVPGVVNFPPKQIGPVRSELLLTGLYRDDGAVVLAVPERPVPGGARLAQPNPSIQTSRC